MKTTILKQSLILLSSATLLAACGGDGGDSPVDDGGANPGESGNQSLLYSYPDDGQSEIATRAPIVLRFSSRVSTNAAEQNITLRREADGTELGFSAEEVPGEPRGVVLQPDEELDPHTRYVIDVQGLALARGPSADREIEFSTRALQRGPKNLVITDSDFELSRTFPSGDEQEPVMDFSTFRFQFTQPIDPATARYGQGGDATVTLTDSEGNLIEAALLVDGPYMTVDPEPEHLDTKTEYTLTLAAGLNSTFEQGFAGDSVTFTPKDSSPRGEPTIMVQRVTEALKPSGDPNRSELTGAPVNEVPVNSTLLGEDSATRSSGDVRAELADVTQYTEVTPVRIPRSTILTGTNIDVMIGGAVPAGISSGAVKMHFLSDATGYLVPNPYADNRDDALRIVRLFMDVAISTENAEANGGFTQDLLHIELIGTAEVDPQAGVLNLDAVSMVEPDVLGQEFATGLLSFQLQSYKDQNNPPAEFADTTPPTLQSWTFGEDGATSLDKTAMIKPTDPIILNFSEPLDRQTVIGKVHLYKNEGGVQTEVDAKVTVDGGAIVIQPAQPLEHPTETGPSLSYQVSADSGIIDLGGQPWVETFDETFELGTLVEEYELYTQQGFGSQILEPSGQIEPTREFSPYVLGLYPGYPCAMNTATRDLANGMAGRCRGGMQPNTPTDDMPGQDGLGALDPLPADDILPVPDMPANRPIIVVFSESIDRDSLFDDQGNTPTFQVYRVSAANPEDLGATVSGIVTLENDTLRFVPDQSWEEGQLYGYTLQSNGDMESSAAQCDADQPAPGLCDPQGLPLKTQLLEVVSTHDENEVLPDAIEAVFKPHFLWSEEVPLPTAGGPDLTQYFMGAPPSTDVLQVLRLPLNVDTNSNLINDSTAQGFTDPGVVSGQSKALTEFRGYQISENAHVDWQPDPSTADLTDPVSGLPLDPDGVKPPPNSAKVLSAFYGYRDMEPILNDAGISSEVLALGANSGLGQSAFSLSANVGCGWSEAPQFPDQTDCDVYGQGFFGKACYYAVPMSCPQNKFTYLRGVLFADVTDQVTQNGEMKVKIYPGHIVTTSFRLFLKSATGTGGELADSEYQVMRMRYPAGEQYITGWITGEPHNGRTPPVLYTSLDLYLDAPLLDYDLTVGKRIVDSADHNQRSYPVSMDLSGSLDFLSDGRMVAEQYNDTPVEVEVRGNTPATHVDLLIPKEGSFLRYVSQPIK
jgi:hypothetical protein